MAKTKTLKLFDEIYDETYNDILKYVVLRSNNLEDAQDIVQNTYIALFKQMFKKKDIQDSTSYLKGIASHKVMDYYRFKYRAKIVSLFEKKDESATILDFVPSEEDIEKITIRKENVENIWSFLKTKKTVISKIFFLYYYCDETIDEIANDLSLTSSNVKNHLYRTLKELKDMKASECDD